MKMKIEKVKNYRDEIIALLAAERLPVSDLPETLENFFVAIDNESVIGVIGLETYDNYGLLRSLAVSEAFRDQGIARQLIENLENAAVALGIKEMYLLTETAPDYFTRNGYRRVVRLDVPSVLHQSSEFSHVCPQSAIVMKKQIK
jgi:amino-acid N-acetyltransferase